MTEYMLDASTLHAFPRPVRLAYQPPTTNQQYFYLKKNKSTANMNRQTTSGILL
jgi:hypothetical protein